MYKIITTKTFILEISKNFEKVDFIKFNKYKEKLKLNPFLGDMIRIYFVREFRLKGGKRIYFIIYEDFKIILFVAISNKKNQQKKINKIFNNLDFFEEFVKKFKVQ